MCVCVCVCVCAGDCDVWLQETRRLEERIRFLEEE